MHDHATGGRGSAHWQLLRHGSERVATRPAYRVDRFEFERRGSVQHASDDERGARKMIAVTLANGSLPSRIAVATAVEPSQRTVVCSPSAGRPPCIQRMIAQPLRMFQIVPAANQATTATAAIPTRLVIMEGMIARPSPARGGRRCANSC